MRPWLVPLLLFSVSLAGCLGDNGSKDDDPTTTGPQAIRYPLPEDPMPEGAGHDHTAPDQHRFLWNYDFAARDPLMQDDVNVAGVHALDVQAGHLFGAVYGAHSLSVNGGLAIWDLADPAHPKLTGRWTIPGSVGGDRSMEATPDGEYVVISTEPVDCAGHVNPSGGVIGAYLIDTRDKANPIVADVMTANRATAGDLSAGRPSTAGPERGQHSVAVHRIGDADYAFIWGKIFKIQRSEDTARLVYVNTIPGGHDTYVRDTPWGTTWALVSYGGGGQAGAMVVWDVTEPTQAFPLGFWDLPDREALKANGTVYYFHTADVSFQGDQILIVETSEDFADHVSPLWILDGNPLRNQTEKPTEPHVLEMLGTWSNPGGHDALVGLTFSLHNPRFHDGGILTVSSYHGGMWQLDVRHPEFWVDPAPIGYAAFADGKPTMAGDPIEQQVAKNLCGLEFALETPSYWDVEIGPNGVTYLADGFMGLYTFTPASSHPVYGDNRTVDYPGTAGL